MNTGEQNQDDITKLMEAIKKEATYIDKQILSNRRMHGKLVKKANKDQTSKRLLDSLDIDRI